MKRFLTLLMVFVVCFSMVACVYGGSKYVGEYKSSDNEYLTVNADGTFVYENKDHTSKGTWEVVDGYLVTTYSDYGVTQQYELRGVELGSEEAQFGWVVAFHKVS